MKSLILFTSVMLISISSFAGNPSLVQSLGSVWKSHQSMQPNQTKNDITIVYGGKDISLRPTLSTSTTTA